MSAKKILEINSLGPGFLFKTLERLAQAQPGILELVHHTEFSQDLLQNADLVLFSIAQSQELLPQLQVLPSLVKGLRSFDAFVSEGGTWYPRLFLYEALHKVLVKFARDLDNREAAFVVGTGAEARAAGAVCANLGFAHVYLVGEDMAGLAEDVQILSRSQFGVEFKIVPLEDLTIQAISAGVMINTVDLADHPTLLNDLSYFNFMKTNGFVLDCFLGNDLYSLISEEAIKADLRPLTPVQVLRSLVELVIEKLGGEELISNSALDEFFVGVSQEISSSV